jgi:rod shape-determining protein MreC
MKFFYKSKISLIIVIFLIVLLTVLNLGKSSKEVRNFFYLISSPIQNTLWQTGKRTSDFLAGVFTAENLKREVENLQLKNQELLSQIITLKELKKENEFLRKALNIGLEKDFQLKLAQVISKDSSKDSILINKGLKDGISQGFPVITSEKALVGRIGEVYQNFSEVILISNKESSFDAKISEKEIFGVIKGKGNSEFYFDLIPKDKEISQGDIVITTTLGGVFPPGIMVGRVKEVKKSDVDPFQTAQINASFNIKNLDNLFVITNF